MCALAIPRTEPHVAFFVDLGVLGFPLIGAFQANKEITEVEKIEVPGLVQNGALINEAKEEGKMYLDLVSYDKINKSIVEEKLTSASPETKDAVQAARDGSAPKALLNMCIFFAYKCPHVFNKQKITTFCISHHVSKLFTTT